MIRTLNGLQSARGATPSRPCRHGIAPRPFKGDLSTKNLFWHLDFTIALINSNGTACSPERGDMHRSVPCLGRATMFACNERKPVRISRQALASAPKLGQRAKRRLTRRACVKHSEMDPRLNFPLRATISIKSLPTISVCLQRYIIMYFEQKIVFSDDRSMKPTEFRFV